MVNVLASLSAYVLSLISDSESQLHDVFTRTYGILYKRNAGLFSSYFRQIRAYYTRGAGGDLQETAEIFFRSLYHKMFQVCTSTHIKF